jgi:hypothetical protein
VIDMRLFWKVKSGGTYKWKPVPKKYNRLQNMSKAVIDFSRDYKLK